MPYGALPNELCEIIDNEKVLPGISQVFKIGEDIPLLNEYDSTMMLESSQNQINW